MPGSFLKGYRDDLYCMSPGDTQALRQWESQRKGCLNSCRQYRLSPGLMGVEQQIQRGLLGGSPGPK